VRPNETRDEGWIRVWTAEEVVAALRRQSRLLTICCLALSAGVVTAVLTASPLYGGKMKILVNRDRVDSVVSGAADPSAARNPREVSEAEVMSQVELLKSEELLRRVASDTGLSKQLQSTHPSYSEAEAEEEATKKLRRRLTITPIKRTWLIDVAYEADDRRTTQQVLDTLVRLYLEKHLALQRPAGTYDFFVSQTDRARQELEALRAQLIAFGQVNQVASAALEKQAVLQSLSQFDALRAESAARLAEAGRRLSVVTSELSNAPGERLSEVTTDTQVVNEVKSRIVSLEMRRTELLQKFTPEYRGVLEVDAQLKQAQAVLDAAERAPVREQTVADNPTRQWLDTEVARARAEEAALGARVQALSASVGEYRARAQTLGLRDVEQQDLEREIKAAETKYLLYAQKREEARISDELDRTRIANVTVAEGPVIAVVPRRDPSLAFLPLLLIAALLISGGIAITADALTPAFLRWKSAAVDRAPLIRPIGPTEEPLA
jgi:uncharacterized protein involved in exopolysaccharide biosynthesis